MGTPPDQRALSDAEDLVQDTLLRAYPAIGRVDGSYRRAWLLTILRNAQVTRVVLPSALDVWIRPREGR